MCVGSDGEECIRCNMVGIIGRVEVEADILAARADREGVGVRGGEDPGRQVRDFRDRRVLLGSCEADGIQRRAVLRSSVAGPSLGVGINGLP